MKNKFNTMFRRFAALTSAAVMLTAAGTGCSGKDKVTIQEPVSYTHLVLSDQAVSDNTD